MPKIYNPEDVKFVWDLIQNNGMKRAAVAELMQIKPFEVDKLYAIAFRKFYNSTISKETQFTSHGNNEGSRKEYERPKAIYSNKSPYGIAGDESEK